MPDPKTLYAQFKKGLAYFAPYRIAEANPVIRRQAAQFDRDVIQKLDDECAKMTRAERQKLETETVPF